MKLPNLRVKIGVSICFVVFFQYIIITSYLTSSVFGFIGVVRPLGIALGVSIGLNICMFFGEYIFKAVGSAMDKALRYLILFRRKLRFDYQRKI